MAFGGVIPRSAGGTKTRPLNAPIFFGVRNGMKREEGPIFSIFLFVLSPLAPFLFAWYLSPISY